MKISKKLMSLLLVAMLLVTAIPFQAMAAEPNIWVNGTGYTNNDRELSADEMVSYAMAYFEATGAFDPLDDAGKAAARAEITTEVNNLKMFPLVLPLSKTISIEIMDENFDISSTDPKADDGDDNVDVIVPPVTDPEEDGDEDGYYTVTIDYTEGSEGEPARKYEMVEGQKFGDRLPANPKRNGMTFKYWYYADTKVAVDSDSLFDPANGTVIKAKWEMKGLFLTLDENRQGEEYVNYGVTVYQGEAIYAKVSKFHPERKGYVFMGWYLNGKKIVADTIYDLGDSATAYAKWEKESDVPGVPNPNEKDGKVYLEIYANGKTGDLVKRVDITSYAKDGKITREEVEKVAKKYVKAQAGKKLSFDGIFDEESWFWYTRDPETDGAASIEVDLWSDHYIFVMVNNVKATTNADTTNPKTGDFMLTGALTMMAISSISAAAVYLTGKKRK